MSYVCIYNGEGSSELFIDHTEKALKKNLDDKYSVVRLDQSYLSRFNGDYKALIYPGGSGLQYKAKIPEETAKKVNTWVNDGGAVFGSCAGAYYLSALSFWKERNLKIFSNDNALFHGTSTYSAYPGFKSNSFKGAVASEVTILADFPSLQLKNIKVLCNGGPILSWDAKQTDAKALATFADIDGSPAAIVQTGPGGRVILSSVHPELDAADIMQTFPDDEDFKRIEPALREHKQENQDLFRSLFESLGLGVKNHDDSSMS